MNTLLWLKLIRSYVTYQQLQLLRTQNHWPALTEYSPQQLRKAGFSDEQAQTFTRLTETTLADDLAWLAQEHNFLITIDDEDYPLLLKNIPDPPIALFVKGQPQILNLPQLAIVGSRNPTARGRETAFDFAKHLAQVGLTITSGLALGIDGAAHQGALAAAGPTIAVCGTGLDRVYPARHHPLAQQIATQGALISEFPLGAGPEAFHFPQRNRIIAGMSLGTLVVEAALQSGSLITAHQAINFGREVFAIPGSIHNPLTRGCHRLIREGAKLVETADDVLEELQPLLTSLEGSLVEAAFRNTPQVRPCRLDPRLPVSDGSSMLPQQMSSANYARQESSIATEEYGKLLTVLDEVPTSINVLADKTGFSAQEIASMLLILELESLVIREPGGYTKRLAK